MNQTISKLRDESKTYRFKDPRWQRNYRQRLNRAARKIDPSDPNSDIISVMIIDHISMITGCNPTWKVTK